MILDNALQQSKHALLKISNEHQDAQTEKLISRVGYGFLDGF